MSDPRGWPDPANPDVPPNHEKTGPHLIKDKRGHRRWAWWISDSSKTFGAWTYAGGGGRGLDWTYIGPAVAPDGLPVD